MIRETFNKRFHVREFNDVVPEEDLIKELIQSTYTCVPSKQLIVPYALTVLGPNNHSQRSRFHEFCVNETDVSYNQVKDNRVGAQLYKAPYVLIFTTRVIDDLSESMQKQYPKSEWCWPAIQVPHTITSAHFIEVGMFCTILSGMCVEHGLASSFSLLFPREGYQGWDKLEFVQGRILFCMTIGYTNEKTPVKRVVEKFERKPSIEKIVEFL